MKLVILVPIIAATEVLVLMRRLVRLLRMVHQVIISHVVHIDAGQTQRRRFAIRIEISHHRSCCLVMPALDEAFSSLVTSGHW